jgi:long-chain acyl-CoA synthetase
MTLEAFPDFHAARTPGKPAYIVAEPGTVVTYGDLTSRSQQAARALRTLGLRPGDGAAIVMENHLRYLEVVWALQRSGAQYAPISSRLLPAEVAYILDDVGAKLLVTSAQLADVAAEAAALSASRPQILCVDTPPEGMLDYEALLAREPAEPADDEIEGFDLLYSSGTTGRPKGIEQTYTPMALGTAPRMEVILSEHWKLDADTVYLSPAPLYHSAPMRFNITVGRFGGTSVVMERFDPDQLLKAIEHYKVTHVQVVPTMFIRMLKLPDEVRSAYDLSSLRIVIHAAAPCPPDVKTAMLEWLGPVVYEYYGTTERNLYTTIGPDEARERPGSVGKPLVGVPHILDDDGEELRVGEIGTIWSEGGLDFAYRNDPEKTAAAYNDKGWSTVGDIGRVDEDGYLYLADRRADMIIAGGVNIYPQEAENVLVTHPEVVDAAVFGIPHPEMGEEVKAVVQPTHPDDAGPELERRLIAHCRERLSSYKCPRSVDFRDELPRHPTGKLYKRLLRDEYVAQARDAGPA